MNHTLHLLLLTASTFAACAQTLSAQQHWVGTWAAAPSPQYDLAQMRTRKLEMSNQTFREIVRVSIGGETVRVRLSNAFSSQPVNIGSAHIALRDFGPAVVPGTDRKLTFSGRATAQIPAGGSVLSDSVALNVPAAGDLAISLYLPR